MLKQQTFTREEVNAILVSLFEILTLSYAGTRPVLFWEERKEFTEGDMDKHVSSMYNGMYGKMLSLIEVACPAEKVESTKVIAKQLMREENSTTLRTTVDMFEKILRDEDIEAYLPCWDELETVLGQKKS